MSSRAEPVLVTSTSNDRTHPVSSTSSCPPTWTPVPIDNHGSSAAIAISRSERERTIALNGVGSESSLIRT
jgi:hypothetical protein